MAKKKKTQGEISLWESDFPMPSKYRQYAPRIFKYIRAAELLRGSNGGYSPAETTCGAARAELRAMFGKKTAKRLIAFYTEAEKNCRLFAYAEDDEKFLAAAEALRGARKAPLMAELDTRTAFALWARAGSYAGAIKLCGLDPPTEDELADNVMRYVVRRASPELLPEDILEKLNGKCLALLQGVCVKARKYMRYPTLAEMKRMAGYLRYCGTDPIRVFRAMGFPFDESEEKGTKPQTDGQKWKNRAHWWLHSDAYSAMKRAANATATEKRVHE